MNKKIGRLLSLIYGANLIKFSEAVKRVKWKDARIDEDLGREKIHRRMEKRKRQKTSGKLQYV